MIENMNQLFLSEPKDKTQSVSEKMKRCIHFFLLLNLVCWEIMGVAPSLVIVCHKCKTRNKKGELKKPK